MNITLKELKTNDVIQSNELKIRETESTKSKKTTHYLGVSQGKEVAFVSIDRWPELDQFVLYELYIPKSLRRKGVGKLVLTEIEFIAKKEGFHSVKLKPHPLDSDINERDLIAWYQYLGYCQDTSANGDLIKKI